MKVHFKRFRGRLDHFFTLTLPNTTLDWLSMRSTRALEIGTGGGVRNALGRRRHTGGHFFFQNFLLCSQIGKAGWEWEGRGVKEGSDQNERGQYLPIDGHQFCSPLAVDLCDTFPYRRDIFCEE